MTDVALQGLRRAPQQRRGQELVLRLLAAADELLATEGAAALTTTNVARAAGVSVGALYRYFPDREAITKALALRYTGELAGVMEHMADAAEAERLGDPAGDILDAFVAAFRARAGFRALWFGGLRTEALRDATRPTRYVIAASLTRALAAQCRDAEEERVSAVARMMVLVGDAVLREAFRLDPDGDEAVLGEARRLLRGYLAAELGLHGAAPAGAVR